MLIRSFSSVVFAAIVFAAGQAAAAAPAKTACADVSGPSFSYSVGAAHYAGSSYHVTAGSVSCSFASGWVGKLTRMGSGKPAGVGKNLLAGPAGWKCEGSGYSFAQHTAPTIRGSCYLGAAKSPTKTFQWSIDATTARIPPVVLDPTVSSGSRVIAPVMKQMTSGPTTST